MATGRVPTTANSPLTAKGDLFTYSTSPARLAVGNNGEQIVADSSTSTGLRYQGNFAAGKNALINADFGIWQRGVGPFTTNVYTADRWNCYAQGTGATFSASQQTFSPGTAPVTGYEGTYFYRDAVVAGSDAASQIFLSQKIEDVRKFANQTVTVSFWAKANTGTPKIGIEFYQEFGSGGSTAVSGTGQAVTISTSWVRYSATFSVPSVSGKTIGTGSSLILNLWLSGGSSSNTRSGSIGLQSATFDLWGVQVESGSTATAFATASGGSPQEELAMCQRYYQKSYSQATAPGTASTTAGTNNYMTISATPAANRTGIRLPVTMRTVPTVTLYSTNSGTSGKIYIESTATDVDGVVYYSGEQSFNYYLNSGTLILGYVTLVQYTASAEL